MFVLRIHSHSDTGQDATEEFDDIGHTNYATDLLKEYLIGTLVDGKSTMQGSSTPSHSTGESENPNA